MKKRWLWGSAVVAFGLTACGCETQHGFGMVGDAPLLQLPPRINGGEGDGLTVARSQQPDAEVKPPIHLLDLPEDHPIDLSEGEPTARIGATVNSEAILNEEILGAGYQELMAARDLPEPERAQRRAEIWNKSLNQLVEREVVLQDAFTRLMKNGGKGNLDKLKEAAKDAFDHQWLQPMMRSYHFPSQDDLRAVMRNQGLSLEMVRRQWERNFMAMEYLRSRIRPYVDEISPKQVLDYYTKHPEEFQRADSVQWQDLFLAADKYKSREEAHRYAETLAERVRQGEDFAKLAQDKDDGYSGVRKGEGIGSKRGEIKPPEVETTLFQLHDGELSVVEMETGFHIVRLVKREQAGLAPFDEKTQKQIKEKLTNEVAQLEMKRIVNRLKHEAVIEYARGK